MTGKRGSGFYPHATTSILNVLVLVLTGPSVTGICAAQETEPAGPLPQAPSAQTSPAPPVDTTRITIPVGTSVPLVLTRPLDSNDVHRGDAVFAQVSNPVMVNDEVVIPAGTFVRGKADRLTRNGTQGELLMHSASLVMGTAVVDLGGPVKIESEQWTAYNNPKGHTKAAIILAPLLGTGLGIGIGAATDKPHTVTIGGGTVSGPGIGILPGPPISIPTSTFTENTHRGLFIGSAVGSAVGLITSFTLMARSHEFYLEEGSPLHMTLANQVSLTRAQIAEAGRNTSPVQVIRRTRTWPGPGNNPPINFPGDPSSGPGSCSAGQEWCMGSCRSSIDFTSDDNNCGRCGNSCRIGESCTGGSCSCAAGSSSCMGSCVSDSSFISDNNNCGSCGHSCSIGESCTGGMCMKRP